MSCILPKRFHSNAKVDDGVQRPPKINMDRDAWALHHLTHLVWRPGDHEEALFNVEGTHHLEEKPIRQLVGSKAIFLTATRLPLNDRDDDARKVVDRSYTWLEERIFDGARRFLTWSSRKHVLLTREGAAVLAPERRDSERGDRAFVRFQVTDDEALYKQCGKWDDERSWPTRPDQIEWCLRQSVLRGRTTAGYIIYTKELWEDGPACLSVFGMSGPTTFGFASALREMVGPNILERLDLTESELIFVEIRPLADDYLVPPKTDGHPTYWRHWHFEWHRHGQIVDLPSQCPPVLGIRERSLAST